HAPLDQLSEALGVVNDRVGQILAGCGADQRLLEPGDLAVELDLLTGGFLVHLGHLTVGWQPAVLCLADPDLEWLVGDARARSASCVSFARTRRTCQRVWEHPC